MEELKATPKLVSLDLSHNPIDCDLEFNDAIQWLTDHGVTPIETSKYLFHVYIYFTVDSEKTRTFSEILND